MAFNFKAVAQQATSLCPLMSGKEKLSTDDVVNKTLTIVAFDFAPKFNKDGTPVVDPETGEADTFGVVVFKEMPDRYYSVGVVFTKVCRMWAAGFDGDAEAASQSLAESGGVQVKFAMSKTKAGNNLVNVIIV